MHTRVSFASAALALLAYLVHQWYPGVTSIDAKIPGPWQTRVSRSRYFNEVSKGDFHHVNVALHKGTAQLFVGHLLTIQQSAVHKMQNPKKAADRRLTRVKTGINYRDLVTVLYLTSEG